MEQTTLFFLKDKYMKDGQSFKDEQTKRLWSDSHAKYAENRAKSAHGNICYLATIIYVIWML